MLTVSDIVWVEVQRYKDVTSDIQAQQRYTEVLRRWHAHALTTRLFSEEKSSWSEKCTINWQSKGLEED